MKIELDNAGLCEAVESHLRSMGLSLEGKSVDVRIIAGRSKGSSAEVTISNASLPPVTTETEPVGDAHLQEDLPLEEDEPEEPVTEEISRPTFGSKA